MSKVEYEEVYGLWGGKEGTAKMPICPKCKQPTYNEDICPFCKEELEYEEDYPSPDDTVRFLRVEKYNFFNYYFSEEPVLILPVEVEENISENE